MSNKTKTISFLNKKWVASLGVFILSQLIFIGFELIGWHPAFRDINNALLQKLMNSVLLEEWLNFYEVKNLNLLTLFFIIFSLIPGIIGCIKEILTYSSRSKRF